MISSNTYSITWLQALLLTCLLALVLPAQAVTEAASVLFSHGNVVLTNDTGSYPLEKGAAVSAGDTVITGEDGRIQMRFSDGGLVSLMPNSRFAVEEYSQPTASSEGSASVNLLKGGMRALSGSIGKKDQDSYKLKTDVATLGIRGTQFVVVMDGAAMRVHVGQGSVSLFNDFGELLVPAGMHAEVFPGQAPVISTTAPVFMSANKPILQDSEEQQREANQSPAVSSTATEVVRTFEPALAQGAKAGTIILKGEDGNESVEETPSGGEANHSETPPTNGSGTVPINPPIDGYVAIPADKGFAQAYVFGGEALNGATSLPSDSGGNQLMSMSYGPDSLGTMLSNSSSSSAEEIFLNEDILNSTPSSVVRVGDLYWGMKEELFLDQSQNNQSLFMTQIWGAAAVNLPALGTLKYSLNTNSAIPVHASWGGNDEVLDRFDMEIVLQTNNKADFKVDMSIANAYDYEGFDNGVNFITAPEVGSNSDFEIGNFNFTALPSGTAGCTSCELDVSGFVSGDHNQGQGQAGVVFNFRTNDGDLTGGAVLDQTDYIPHVP